METWCISRDVSEQRVHPYRPKYTGIDIGICRVMPVVSCSPGVVEFHGSKSVMQSLQMLLCLSISDTLH